MIIGCSFAGVIIICILLFLLKKTFIKSKIEDWKILNQDFLPENREKIETEEHNLFTQPAENNLLIVPKIFRICGKKIRTPQIIPLGLIPVIEEGVVIGYKSEYKEKLVRSDFLNNTNKELVSKTCQIIEDRENVTL